MGPHDPGVLGWAEAPSLRLLPSPAATAHGITTCTHRSLGSALPGAGREMLWVHPSGQGTGRAPGAPPVTCLPSAPVKILGFRSPSARVLISGSRDRAAHPAPCPAGLPLPCFLLGFLCGCQINK